MGLPPFPQKTRKGWGTGVYCKGSQIQDVTTAPISHNAAQACFSNDLCVSVIGRADER